LIINQLQTIVDCFIILKRNERSNKTQFTLLLRLTTVEKFIFDIKK
jgi:hypothetical protein